MKIYEIGTGYTPIPARMGAATEIVVEELTKAMMKQGIPVEIIDIEAKERLAHHLPIREVKVPGVFAGTDVKLGLMHKLKRVVYSLCLAGELKKILKNTDEKVILHFHNQYNLFFFLKLISPALRQKAMIAYTVHSYIWPGEWDEIKETIQKRYFQEVFCVQHADAVLVLNDKTAEHFVTHLGVAPEKIHKIGNGVNTDVYRILDRGAVDAFKERVGLAGKKIVFQVGSVCDRKNQLGAVQLLKPLLQNRPELVYVYAGGVIDGEYQQQIQQFAREHQIADQVVYAGELCPGEELNRYYNAADMTVFPSKVESFGLVIIESISAGAPVILAEKPLFALQNGWQVFDSEDAFVQLTDSYLNTSGRETEGRNEVIRLYSWEKVVQDHLKIWSM